MLLSLEITMFAVNRISKTFLVSLVLVTFVMTNLPEVFFKKRCSWKFHKIDRKTPVPETLFNKVAGLRPATLLKKSLWHRCFPVNFEQFLKTPSLQNKSGRLLLDWKEPLPVALWLVDIKFIFNIQRNVKYKIHSL